LFIIICNISENCAPGHPHPCGMPTGASGFGRLWCWNRRRGCSRTGLAAIGFQSQKPPCCCCCCCCCDSSFGNRVRGVMLIGGVLIGEVGGLEYGLSGLIPTRRLLSEFDTPHCRHLFNRSDLTLCLSFLNQRLTSSSDKLISFASSIISSCFGFGEREKCSRRT